MLLITFLQLKLHKWEGRDHPKPNKEVSLFYSCPNQHCENNIIFSFNHYFLTWLFSAMGFIGRMFEWSNKEWRMCKKFFFLPFLVFGEDPNIEDLWFFYLIFFSSHSRLVLHPRPPQQWCRMSITEDRNKYLLKIKWNTFTYLDSFTIPESCRIIVKIYFPSVDPQSHSYCKNVTGKTQKLFNFVEDNNVPFFLNGARK